jgi:hypothetical protein
VIVPLPQLCKTTPASLQAGMVSFERGPFADSFPFAATPHDRYSYKYSPLGASTVVSPTAALTVKLFGPLKEIVTGAVVLLIMVSLVFVDPAVTFAATGCGIIAVTNKTAMSKYPNRRIVFIKCSSHKYNTEIPRRINTTNIFTSKGDDFDNHFFSLAPFPPVSIIFGDPPSQIRASEMIFSGRFKLPVFISIHFPGRTALIPRTTSPYPSSTHGKTLTAGRFLPHPNHQSKIS